VEYLVKVRVVIILAIAMLALSERSFAHTHQPVDVKSLAQADPAAADKAVVEPAPESSRASRDSDTVIVSFRFSPLEIDPSLVEYLNLTPRQLRAIQRLISQERREIDPLKTQLQSSHRKLLAAAGQGQSREAEVLAATEAGILTKLLIKSAHMQARLRNLLTHKQQEKLADLNRSTQP